MSLQLINLDERTRVFMLDEFRSDVSNGRLYVSPRLTERGRELYAQLLEKAVKEHNDTWLANQLRINGLIKTHEQRRRPTGGISTVKVSVNAAETLAEGEINRFYIRGLCLRAKEDGLPEVLVYRAKEVMNPRRESELLIGRTFPVEKVLEDIRANPGVDTALGLPPGPNSGLSVRLP
jgi:hypothetical protein